VPVTDLVGSPLVGSPLVGSPLVGSPQVKNSIASNKKSKHSSYEAYKTYETYENLPLEAKEVFYCKRIHQLLFNETVEILEETKKEVKIKILNSFYSDKYGIKQSTYWARKKDFILFDKLKKKKLDLSYIPHPIRYNQTNIKNNKNIITLKLPFFDKITDQTYSAGTRFVIAPFIFPSLFSPILSSDKSQYSTNNFSNNPFEIKVYIFDKKSLSFKTTLIPKNIYVHNTQNSNTEKRKSFISLLKSWANSDDGFIPYVWGGCSFTHLCKEKYKEKCKENKTSQIHKKSKSGKDITIYIKKDFKTNPIPGIDCSGLVLRATQICNIPYFYKNSSTANKRLKKVNNIKDLKNGDLIFYSGHIIVVSDKKNNKIIEAKTIKHGYGKVHEISLEEAFDGIKTYEDLFKIKKQKKVLKRKNKDGTIVQTKKKFNFLKLI